MTTAVILAAGRGTRMNSSLPKVLHTLIDRPLIDYVLECLEGVCEQRIVVVGYRADLVKKHVASRYDAEFVLQEEQLGTGHAVKEALRSVRGERIVVVPGDMPFIRAESVKRVCRALGEWDAAVLGCRLEDPTGYGRIVVENERILRIVEEADATDEERRIKLVNTGVMGFRRQALERIIGLIKNDNAKGEYYITDAIQIMVEAGYRVALVEADPIEGTGINDRFQLAEATRLMSRLNAERIMGEGVTVMAPETLYIGRDVEVGRDTIIYPYVFLLGRTKIGEGCRIGPFTTIADSRIGNNVVVNSHSVIEGAVAEDGVSIGPFARLREGTLLKSGSRIGNFVEVKKSTIGENSKANHLAYIGDATVGRDVNIGAGTITCNYDGVKKHPTVIEDGVFIGSDTQLVAPVKIGAGSLIGAGSTITKDVPPDSLAITRAPMRVFEGKGMKYFIKRKYGAKE